MKTEFYVVFREDRTYREYGLPEPPGGGFEYLGRALMPADRHFQRSLSDAEHFKTKGDAIDQLCVCRDIHETFSNVVPPYHIAKIIIDHTQLTLSDGDFIEGKKRNARAKLTPDERKLLGL